MIDRNEFLRQLTIFNLGCGPKSILEKYGFNIPQNLLDPAPMQQPPQPGYSGSPQQQTPPTQTQPQPTPQPLQPTPQHAPQPAPQQPSDSLKQLKRLLSRWTSPIT